MRKKKNRQKTLTRLYRPDKIKALSGSAPEKYQRKGMKLQ